MPFPVVTGRSDASHGGYRLTRLSLTVGEDMKMTQQVAVTERQNSTSSEQVRPGIMRALVFRGPNQISVEEVSIPRAGYGEVVLGVTLTTICGTDVHILKGEYPVRPGLIIGHEAVGVIHEIGPGVTGYEVGERVLVGAITPCGQCNYCLGGNLSQCGGAIGGWKFGNTINGAQAEYVLVPHAQANLAKIPDELSDDQVILLARHCLHWLFRFRISGCAIG